MSELQEAKETPLVQLQKNDIVINPTTGRPIKVGSSTYLRLLKKGLITQSFNDPNELDNINEGDDVDEKIKEFNKILPDTEQAVRGRGKHAGTIVRRSKQPTIEQTALHTIKKVSNIISDPDVYDELQNADNFESELEKLILQELMGFSKKSKTTKKSIKEEHPKKNKIGKKKTKKESYYITSESDESESESESE